MSTPRSTFLVRCHGLLCYSTHPDNVAIETQKVEDAVGVHLVLVQSIHHQHGPLLRQTRLRLTHGRQGSSSWPAGASHERSALALAAAHQTATTDATITHTIIDAKPAGICVCHICVHVSNVCAGVGVCVPWSVECTCLCSLGLPVGHGTVEEAAAAARATAHLSIHSTSCEEHGRLCHWEAGE